MGNQVEDAENLPVIKPMGPLASDTEIVQAMAVARRVSSTDLAVALGIPSREALGRLRQLKKAGLVRKRQRHWVATNCVDHPTRA